MQEQRMHHRAGFRVLGIKASRRKALLKNMLISLFRHERIKTTHARAWELRRHAEKLITRAKKDSVHNRRIVWKKLRDKAILTKLFTVIAPRFSLRNGGYTRMLKLSFRKGDAAHIVLLELLDREENDSSKKKTSTTPTKKKEQAEKKTLASVS